MIALELMRDDVDRMLVGSFTPSLRSIISKYVIFNRFLCGFETYIKELIFICLHNSILIIILPQINHSLSIFFNMNHL